jgi:UDP-N-acetylmuramoylalanine--D-glutamate ligase
MNTGYNGKSVLIVGAAKSGISSARFLLAAGARVTLTDSQPLENLPHISPLLNSKDYPGELLLELGGHNNDSFRTCDFVVVSPGVPLALPNFDISRKAGIPVIAEIELAARHLKGRIIGITGSNGKTTTTSLVSELLVGAGLKGHAAGNIGTPLIELVAGSSPEDIYAVELSSFQLEGIDQFRPAIGSILNLTPDHMDRYDGFEDYIAAKRRIFLNQQKTDFAVLNADDPRTAEIASQVASTPVLFSRTRTLERGAYVRDNVLFYRDETGEQKLFASDAISLKGAHNLENVLAACAMAILAGASVNGLEANVRKFKGVEHRIEFVCEINGVQYFNDSKATNVDATIKSLEAFPGNIVLIAGGKDKAGDFTVLQSLVRERVKHLVLIGQAAGKIREALSGTVDISEADSMQNAVYMCSQIARSGDIVLLAPACASFDMFRDYEHRGRVFKDAVRSLKKDA